MRIAALAVLVLLAGCTGPNSATGRRQYLSTHPDLTAEQRMAIRSGKVLVGMTPADVLSAWGDTSTKEHRATEAGQVETWAYCAGRGRIDECPKRVTFHDGRVVEVVD